jgi:hypothetical protein
MGGVYGMWFAIGLLALVGFVLLLVVPGLWVLGLIAVALAIVWGIAYAIGAAVRGAAGGTTSDTEERHEEFDRLEDERRRAR